MGIKLGGGGGGREEEEEEEEEEGGIGKCLKRRNRTG